MGATQERELNDYRSCPKALSVCVVDSRFSGLQKIKICSFFGNTH